MLNAVLGMGLCRLLLEPGLDSDFETKLDQLFHFGFRALELIQISSRY